MVPLRSAGRTADRGRKPPQICQPRHDHRQEVRPNRPATPPFSPIMARHRRRLAAEKNSPRGPQRSHPLLEAPHRRPTAPAHPPERLPTTQQLVKESCTVRCTTGRRLTCSSAIVRATSSVSSSSKQYCTSSDITSRIFVSGPLP